VPVIVGFTLGTIALAGFLAGMIVSGQLLAVFMANAGGAWDNAKKIVEVELKQKGTPLHDATVVGDTVGDPFKDTSSVALNPVIKFTTLFGLLAVELATKLGIGEQRDGEQRKDIDHVLEVSRARDLGECRQVSRRGGRFIGFHPFLRAAHGIDQRPDDGLVEQRLLRFEMLEEGGLVDFSRLRYITGTRALEIGAGEDLLRGGDDRFAALRCR